LVRFATGRYARCWVKNVVAIGNASGFVEPLEATALGVIAMQARLVAETLIDSDSQPRCTQQKYFNEFHSRNWDSIRGFIAMHYRFNDRLDTPFWRACRADVELGRAERVVEYYKENGPSAMWEPTLFDEFDSFKSCGYSTLLVGMRVPYERTHDTTEAELRQWEAKRRGFKEAALRAMTIRETLDTLRSPKWKWM
jgi:tryptophan halogenase